ncbi:MAG: hypothetical protein J7M40_11960 [Planctomycetes bacterium]|nr:hypothetical protein [Planctomycetota bacterium]
MGRIVFSSGILILTLSLSGCIISIGSGGRKHDPDYVHVHHTDTIIAEIDVAGRLFSDSDKADVYAAIAQRQGLSSKAQSYLVKEVFHHIFSESSKEKVIIALIENPCFDDVGKKTVLANLHRFFSDSSKKRVLQAMNRREQAPKIVETEITADVAVQAPAK